MTAEHDGHVVVVVTIAVRDVAREEDGRIVEQVLTLRAVGRIFQLLEEVGELLHLPEANLRELRDLRDVAAVVRDVVVAAA